MFIYTPRNFWQTVIFLNSYMYCTYTIDPGKNKMGLKAVDPWNSHTALTFLFSSDPTPILWSHGNISQLFILLRILASPTSTLYIQPLLQEKQLYSRLSLHGLLIIPISTSDVISLLYSSSYFGRFSSSSSLLECMTKLSMRTNSCPRSKFKFMFKVFIYKIIENLHVCQLEIFLKLQHEIF